MDKTKPAHATVADGHVGHLKGHADNEREVAKVNIAWYFAIREVEPTAIAPLDPLVEAVRVLQREYEVAEYPRQSKRRERGRYAVFERGGALRLERERDKHDQQGYDHHEDEQGTACVVAFGPLSHRLRR